MSHHCNYTNTNRFLSPPITPKQLVESNFYPFVSNDEDIDRYKSSVHERWVSSIKQDSLPPSPPQCAIVSFDLRKMERKARHPRKQIKPTRSPPSNAKGAFEMPSDVFATLLAAHKKLSKSHQSASCKKKAVTKRKYTLTTAAKEEKKEEAIPKEDQQAPSEASLLPSSSSSPPPSAVEEVFVKKSNTGAAHIYDNLSADCDQAILFQNSEEWIPNLQVFDRKPTIRVSWKGSPLKIKNMPYFDKLHPGEVTIAATLRLTPEQYLKCKWALVLAAKEAYETGALFRKSEAQKVCCIDVNKTSVLWNTFGRLGWLGSKWPQ